MVRCRAYKVPGEPDGLLMSLGGRSGSATFGKQLGEADGEPLREALHHVERWIAFAAFDLGHQRLRLE